MKTILQRSMPVFILILLGCLSCGDTASKAKEEVKAKAKEVKDKVKKEVKASLTDSIATPFGLFHKDHVHQHPAGAVVSKNTDGTHSITNPDGTKKHLKRVDSTTPVSNRPAANTSLPINHAWLNYASFYVPSGVEVGTFNANYIVPQTPSNISDGSVLYYFTGIQDNGSNPLTILQPVLAWNGNGAEGQWSLSSWNCCPAGQVTQGNVVTGMKPGDIIYTSMVKNGSDYTVTGTWNGQSATLKVNTGTEFFNWPNATLEVYYIDECTDFAIGPMTFYDMEMKDTNGNPISMNWGITGNGAVCNTRLGINANSITIQQN